MANSLGPGFWLVFLFGVGSEKFLQGETLTAWETGLGYSAPICTTLSEVYRHEKNVLGAFILFLASIAIILYIAIEPQHIFSLRYVLANLYVLYAIGAMVLSYQAWRNADYGTRTKKQKSHEFDHPIRCGICSFGFPFEDLYTFDCPKTHTYHESCLFRRALEGQSSRNTCPGCNAHHPIRQKTYPRSEPNFLDKSRLIWYINSLFSRRIRLLVRRFGYWQRPTIQNASPMTDRALLQALSLVLLVHMFTMTSFIVFVHVVHIIYNLPFGWLFRLFILLYVTTVLRLVPWYTMYAHRTLPENLAPDLVYFGYFNLRAIIEWISTTVYCLLGYCGLNMDQHLELPRRETLMKQSRELYDFLHTFVTQVMFMYLLFFVIGPLIIIASSFWMAVFDELFAFINGHENFRFYFHIWVWQTLLFATALAPPYIKNVLAAYRRFIAAAVVYTFYNISHNPARAVVYSAIFYMYITSPGRWGFWNIVRLVLTVVAINYIHNY